MSWFGMQTYIGLGIDSLFSDASSSAVSMAGVTSCRWVDAELLGGSHWVGVKILYSASWVDITTLSMLGSIIVSRTVASEGVFTYEIFPVL